MTAPTPLAPSPGAVRAPLPARPDDAAAHRRGRLTRRATLVGWSFLLPNFLGFALFTLVPVVVTFGLAFMDWDGYNPATWVGGKNFERLWHDSSFWIALRNTLYYAVGHVPVTLAVSLGLAVLLNQKLRGVAFFRTAAFFPYVTSMVAVAIVWNMLFHPTAGPINQALTALGVSDPPGWTSSTTWAMPAVIITGVWKDMGYYMVLFLAGLQTIPTEYYEAARVDGANAWQRFWHVTIPCLRQTTFLVLVLLTVGSFKIFDLIVVMTQGGPGRATTVLSQQIWQRGIVEGKFGYASAMSLVLFVIILVVTVVQFRVNARKDR